VVGWVNKRFHRRCTIRDLCPHSSLEGNTGGKDAAAVLPIRRGRAKVPRGIQKLAPENVSEGGSGVSTGWRLAEARRRDHTRGSGRHRRMHRGVRVNEAASFVVTA
jgi:hypothetical protein